MTKTADLCDQHGDAVIVAEPLFADFGGLTEFAGPIDTVKVFEDFALVRERLSAPGEGRVLVVDGGGSLRCALLGGKMAKLAETNGWHGVVINGCVRDTEDIVECRIGVKALTTHPRRGRQRGIGETGVPVHFADVTFTPEHYVYADEDGLIVTSHRLD